MAKLSETTAKQTIAMMRSIANHKPITPFHLMAADQMESLLNEVLEYRKGKNEKPTRNDLHKRELPKLRNGKATAND